MGWGPRRGPKLMRPCPLHGRPMPDGLSFLAAAAISCGTGTAWGAAPAAATRGRHHRDLRAGPGGWRPPSWLRAMGARVIALDISASRFERSRQFGAWQAVNPAEVDLGRGGHPGADRWPRGGQEPGDLRSTARAALRGCSTSGAPPAGWASDPPSASSSPRPLQAGQRNDVVDAVDPGHGESPVLSWNARSMSTACTPISGRSGTPSRHIGRSFRSAGLGKGQYSSRRALRGL